MQWIRKVSPQIVLAIRALRAFPAVFTPSRVAGVMSGFARFAFSPVKPDLSAVPVRSGPPRRLTPAPSRNDLRDFYDFQNADRRFPPGRDPGGRHQG